MAKKTASPVVQSPTARATPAAKTATVTPAPKTTTTAAPISRDQLMAQVVASTMGPPAPSPQQIAANVAATEARLAAAPATTAAVTQQPSGISLTGPASVSPPPPKPTKLETISSYSAPAGTVINTTTVNEILKKNIDGGDPNIITGEKLKSAEEKGQIDPSLGNLLSVKSSIAKGAAAVGVTKNIVNSGRGTAETSYTSYGGDLVSAAKSLGIDVNSFTTTSFGSYGGLTKSIDKPKLYNAINDKANQLGLYAITERDPGATGSGDNATHITTYYQNSNGVLQPLKDANGQTATTKFKADTYVNDPGFLGGLWEGIKGIATELAPIISLALPNLGLTGLQLLAAQSAQAIATGASPVDVLKGAIGSLAAAQVPEFLDELNILSSASPALKSVLHNAAVQATFATFTDQDVALNAIAGAIGGTAAELFKDLGDPALQKAIGEYSKNKSLGMSDFDAGMFAAQDYAQSLAAIDSKKRTAAQNQVVEAFSQPRTPGAGTQIGEATAELSSIGGQKLEPALAGQGIGTNQPLFEGSGFVVGTNQQAGPVKDIVIEGKTYQTRDITDASGTTTYYFDPIDKAVTALPIKTQPSAGEIKQLSPVDVVADRPSIKLTPKLPIAQIGGGGTPTTPKIPGISLSAGGTPGGTTGGVPGGTTGGTPGGTAGGVPGGVISSRDRDILDLTGIAPTAPSEEPLRVDVEGGQKPEEPTLPPVEVIGERETELTPKPQTEEEIPEEDQLLTLTPKPKDTIILDLISGGGVQRGQRIPTTPEAESMAALTQALRIGDPGDALFGGKLGRRRNVWNVESLRLRDELGG